MINKMKCIIAAVSFVIVNVTSVAQPAYSDLMNALHYSQNGPANAAFDGSGQYNNYYWNHTSSYISGASVSRATPVKRTATNMSNVGLKTSSSGYNVGAERARRLAEQRADRIRREMERREKMIASYMAPRYAASQNRGIAVKAFIIENSNAKPLNQEEIDDIISKGLPGNFIIDDDGNQYFLPENLLEGTGETHETLDDKLKNMSYEEMKRFAKELESRQENGDELTDEEWDFLFAWEEEEIARLKEEERRLKEEIKRMEEERDRMIEDAINNSLINLQ